MHERIIKLYEDNAAAWDRQRGRELFEKAWVDRFLDLLPKRGSILDIGCGMGEPIARYFIESGFAVTGVDSSPSLIALCRDRFPEHRWLVGDMRELALQRRFDGIIAWHSFFHLTFDDQRAMFPRFAAHAEAGAILMFTSGPMHGEAIGEWQGEPLYHASLAPEEYRALLKGNGFEVLSFVAGEPLAEGPSVWMCRQISPASGLDGSA
ncbi:MAG: class I SAM-dependent methyltransferase [Pseudomonadota bacterium]|nr:class I SAM-dependent methyltransferase [Pseudomonadota bacterium]